MQVNRKRKFKTAPQNWVKTNGKGGKPIYIFNIVK